jgi:hypothetical protein
MEPDPIVEKLSVTLRAVLLFRTVFHQGPLLLMVVFEDSLELMANKCTRKVGMGAEFEPVRGLIRSPKLT